MKVKQEFLECVQKDTFFNQEIKREIVDVIENSLLTLKQEPHSLPSEEFFFNSKHVSTMQDVGADPCADLNPLDFAKIKSNDSNFKKHKVTETKYIVPKSELLSSLLNDYCDLPTIKSDIDLYEEPYSSSKEHKEINEQSKKYISKQNVKSYLFHPISKMGYQNTQRRLVRPRNHFWKHWLACKNCGHFYTKKFENLTHSFNHTVKMNTRHLLNSKTNKPLLKTYKNFYVLSKKAYLCKKNIKPLKNKILIKKHLKTDQNSKCKICRKQFSQKAYLNKHLRIHIGETPFKCETCLQKFTLKSYLNKHLKIHIGETPFKCGICSRQFTLKNKLKFHLKMHTGEKPFECELCLKQFLRKQDFNNHLRIHTGEKPFKCAICLKQFKQKAHLCAHLKIHTDEKLFQCEICSKCFAQKVYLKKHLKMHAEKTLNVKYV